MLDIIEDYLHLRTFKVERIDGSITGMKRQAAIDRFQSKDTKNGREQPFIMLLSTRAGGVGINLTAADTCVSFMTCVFSYCYNSIVAYFAHLSTCIIYWLLFSRSYLTRIGILRMISKRRHDAIELVRQRM